VLADTGDPPVEVVWRGAGYLLRTDPDTIDVHRFFALVEQARREVDQRRVALLDEALGLWSGPAISATAATDEIRHLLCQGLEETRLAASEDRMVARLRLGEHREVLGELATLVGAHPLRERLVGLQMRALYRCGRPADALEAYRLLGKRLADELGLDPGDELRQLQIAIDSAAPPRIPTCRLSCTDDVSAPLTCAAW
jgi:DNA-binding SARP family transcriptional activator